ncbi:MAG: type II toxin-antitoxin system VapC family toxin [Deltaproteobacteria bacterium]|nr:type II toxin-antitoxin system VapC family toxin [Deltaproteobacteria bacterium]
MILVDSSAWIEYFNDGNRAPQIKKYLVDLDKIIVPTIVIFEVYKKISREISNEDALRCIGSLNSCRVVDLNSEIALTAADFSLEHKLGMADSCILAAAFIYKAQLITLDHDFLHIPGVTVLSHSGNF